MAAMHAHRRSRPSKWLDAGHWQIVLKIPGLAPSNLGPFDRQSAAWYTGDCHGESVVPANYHTWRMRRLLEP
jgi:hypothetical protein